MNEFDSADLRFLPEPVLLRNWFDHVGRRPEMYLATKSLTALSQFAYGYSLAYRHYGARTKAERLNSEGLDPGFVHWLAAEKGIGEGAKSVFWDVAERSPDEAAAFDRFFELLDEYESRGAG